MRGTWYRGLAVGVTSAALVLAGGLAAAATPNAPDPSGADHAGAAAAPWLPGAMARSIRQLQVPAERYEAAAAELAATRRADALSLAHGALRAAHSVDAVAAAVAGKVEAAATDTTEAAAAESGTAESDTAEADDAATDVAQTQAAAEAAEALTAESVEALTEGVAELTALLEESRFEGVQVGAVPGDERIPDGDVVPAPAVPERDLLLAKAIEDAAAEVFRLSIQVEVAAREAEVDEPIGGPGDLRAPAALEPVDNIDEDVAGEGDAGTASSADDGAEPGVPGGGDEPSDRGAEGAAGGEFADADRGAEQPAGGEGEAGGAEAGADGDAPAVAGGPDTEGPSSEGSDTEGRDDADGSGADEATPEDAEPASLDALPAELVEGLAELESAVAASAALLSSDILDLDQVPFLTPERARLLALAQDLDGDDVAAWSQWSNGRIPTDQLCGVAFAPDRLLRCDAAYALELVNVEYRAEFGEDMRIVSAYRTYDQQVRLKATKGWLAATPGTSNHGWGLAVDLGGMGGLRDYSSPRYRWMVENGPVYGWYHPRSMQPGGSGPPEPWHFEFGLGAGGPGPAQQAPEVS